MNQELALQISIHAMAAVALGFVYVALNARITANIEAAAILSNRLRKRLFWILIALLIPISWSTLDELPHAMADGAARDGDPQLVRVVAAQWQWDIRPSRVRAGRPVIFEVTAIDVNHDFAIYDSDMRMVAQTQAMPGYVNRLRHSFERPGLYKVLCLEYCGTSHHRMRAEIEVTGEGD